MSDSLLSEIFKGLQFSTALLLGLTIGTGLAVPLVLHQAEAAFGPVDEFTPVGFVFLGLYVLAVALLGTWTSLGLFGRWAGRAGGRPVRLAVQIAGIALAAFVTLPVALIATVLLMILKGEPGSDERRPPDGFR
ncbi:MAG: hypothetical protein HY291_16445 [Planctomycetes bacterium]|nr:hypothetical protein [Planctomycetota bacterium]